MQSAPLVWQATPDALPNDLSSMVGLCPHHPETRTGPNSVLIVLNLIVQPKFDRTAGNLIYKTGQVMPYVYAAQKVQQTLRSR